MSRNDFIGLGLLGGLMLLFIVLFILTVRRPSGPARPLEENALIERRMEINESRQP